MIAALAADGRAPAIVALENVCGALTSHGGRDFEAICRTQAKGGYRPAALVINAELFVPQSRPRLFVVGVREDVAIDPGLLAPGPVEPFPTASLACAVEALPADLRRRFLWWRLPAPPRRRLGLADVVEEAPQDVAWHSPAETRRRLDLMSPVNRAKVTSAQGAGRRRVGCVYRTRPGEDGGKVQRAEVRFDDVSGCLRTPAGGSSRQTILVVDGPQIRSRLVSARETARLMGLPDDYRLPKTYDEAYHLTGDGVVVDVVRHLARRLFEPILQGEGAVREVA